MIIDLERGGFLEDLFRLPYAFAVPDLLFHRELRVELGDRLVALGLIIQELYPAELTRAIAVRRERTVLSAPDTFAFAIAEQRRWALLTGDGALRRLAADSGVETHGLLWLCYRFEEHEVLGYTQLHAGLKTISTHPRCRLPAAEVRVRLNRYSV